MFLGDASVAGWPGPNALNSKVLGVLVAMDMCRLGSFSWVANAFLPEEEIINLLSSGHL